MQKQPFNKTPLSVSDPDSLRVKGELVIERMKTVNGLNVWFLNAKTEHWSILGTYYFDKTFNGFYPSELKKVRELIESVTRKFSDSRPYKAEIDLSPLFSPFPLGAKDGETVTIDGTKYTFNAFEDSWNRKDPTDDKTLNALSQIYEISTQEVKELLGED